MHEDNSLEQLVEGRWEAQGRKSGGGGQRNQRRDRQNEEEKDENETVTAQRRCVGSVSVEAFDIFSQGEDLECCGGFSWRDLLEEPDDLSDCDPETRTDVSAVHGTENLLNRSPLLSPRSVLSFGQFHRKR